MPTQPTVLKFGGTSVADAPAFLRVARIVELQLNVRPVVVTSAMSRVTDALLASVQRAATGAADAAAHTLAAHFTRLQEAAGACLGVAAAAQFRAELDSARQAVSALLRAGATTARGSLARLQDEVVAYGERLAASLLAAVLRATEVGPDGTMDRPARRTRAAADTERLP